VIFYNFDDLEAHFKLQKKTLLRLVHACIYTKSQSPSMKMGGGEVQKMYFVMLFPLKYTLDIRDHPTCDESVRLLLISSVHTK